MDQQESLEDESLNSNFDHADSTSQLSYNENQLNQNLNEQQEIIYLPINYEFIEFSQNQNQICYIDELLKDKKQAISMKNLEQLDLLELSNALQEAENNQMILQTKKTNLSIEQITRNQLKLIQKFGTVELPSKISKKTGLYGKEDTEGNQPLANYYDTNDPFIDDELIDDGLKEFQTFESNYEDYNCCQGNLIQLLKQEPYQKRIEELKQIRTFKQAEQQIYVDNSSSQIDGNKSKKQQRKRKEKQQLQQPTSSLNQIKESQNQCQKLLSLSPESNHQPEKKQQQQLYKIPVNIQKKKNNNNIQLKTQQQQQKKISSTTSSSSQTNNSSSNNKENCIDQSNIQNSNSNIGFSIQFQQQQQQLLQQQNVSFEHLKKKRKRKETAVVQQNEQENKEENDVLEITSCSSSSLSRTNNFKIIKN